ncbi:MAG TPA: hemolysin family protein [Dehalococcoidia bacterium]|nr:hemolysin family protein [Dehalococcoidia bacterium]
MDPSSLAQTLPLLQERVDIGVSVPAAVALLLIGLAGYALVNAVEIAVVAVSRIRVRHLVEQGSRAAQALDRLRSDEERFFSLIILLQNVFIVLASIMGGVVSADIAPGPAWLRVAVGTVLTAFVTAELGEATPKVLAARLSERIALAAAIPMRMLMRALAPLVTVVAVTPTLVSRLLIGERARVTPTVTEAELRMLIDIAAEERAVGEAEAELLDRVFHFHDRRVNEVMIPRTEVVWLESGSTLADFFRVFDETPHSRFPVYHETVDNVVGVVGIKDVLRALARKEADESTPVDRLMRPAFFVPETKPVSTLFWQMQQERNQLAIVVDEYGGVAGIVTLELLLEEMVGRVVDELGQPAETEFQTIDERTVEVDGGMSIFDLREELEIELPEGDYETIAGYVLERLGHIPKVGESFVSDGFVITVTEMDGVKIEKVRLVRQPAGAPSEESR